MDPAPTHVDVTSHTSVDPTHIPPDRPPATPSTGALPTPDRDERLRVALDRAARLLPDGASTDDLEVREGDWIVGAAARVLLDSLTSDATHGQGQGIDVREAVAIGDPTRHLVHALQDEIAQLRAGAAESAGDPHAVPTPAEWIAGFLGLDGPGRIRAVESIADLSGRAHRCAQMFHDARITDLEHTVVTAAAEIGRLRAQLAERRLTADAAAAAADDDVRMAEAT